MNVILSDEFLRVWPRFCVAWIEAEVTNSEYNAGLWDEINAATAQLCSRYTTETLKLHPAISATREAYRAFGKDPSRYRPSCEQLVRRLLQGKSLYKIHTLVDLNNLASIEWGYSIGGFDLNRIEGPDVTLGIGRAGEPYEGIGRGPLNIENLPVYRDAVGGIGTPTSDHERTKLGLSTTRLLFLVNGYDGDAERTQQCALRLQELLRRYAQSDGGTLYFATKTADTH